MRSSSTSACAASKSLLACIDQPARDGPLGLLLFFVVRFGEIQLGFGAARFKRQILPLGCDGGKRSFGLAQRRFQVDRLRKLNVCRLHGRLHLLQLGFAQLQFAGARSYANWASSLISSATGSPALTG